MIITHNVILTHVFFTSIYGHLLSSCVEGVCRNLTSVYTCEWSQEEVEPSQNCFYKRNCVELEGMFTCR